MFPDTASGPIVLVCSLWAPAVGQYLTAEILEANSHTRTALVVPLGSTAAITVPFSRMFECRLSDMTTHETVEYFGFPGRVPQPKQSSPAPASNTVILGHTDWCEEHGADCWQTFDGVYTRCVPSFTEARRELEGRGFYYAGHRSGRYTFHKRMGAPLLPADWHIAASTPGQSDEYADLGF
jgi:hypothetical protein